MGKQLAAVIGVGQTHHQAKRLDVSIAGLCREAIDRALADAELGFDDIDAVVVGKAPDLFEGVMMPELYLADALGAAGKPLLRVHTAGSVGGSTAIVAARAWSRPACTSGCSPSPSRSSRSPTRCGRSRCRSRSPCRCMPAPAATSRRTCAPTSAAPGRPEHIGRDGGGQGPAERAEEPLRAPAPPDTTVESVLASQMLWDPIRYDETCPSSDGACALVIADEGTASSADSPAWIHGTAMRSEPTTAAERDQVNPQAGRDAAAALWKQAGITNPIDGDRLRRDLRAVLVVRADVAGEPRLLGGGRGLEAHRGRRDRDRRQAAGQHVRRRALPRTRSAPPACSGSPSQPCRSWARPASTRSTAPVARSATPTAAARSSSRCGSWGPPSRAPDRSADADGIALRRSRTNR